MHPTGLRGALLTGPIYVEGAEPGDTLEVRMHDVRFALRAASTPRAGPAVIRSADLVPRPWTQSSTSIVKRTLRIFKEGEIELPLAPFMGQMGVAPPAPPDASAPVRPRHSRRQLRPAGTDPRRHAVPAGERTGALFFTGNGHALQGNGEITGPSLRSQSHRLLRVHRPQE